MPFQPGTAGGRQLPPDTGLYIGLMSGTSTDGIDGVLASFSATCSPATLAHASLPMPPDLREHILALNQPGDNELARSARVANELARLYARIVHTLLDQTGLTANCIRAVGAHGQTVRHAPEHGYTIQLNSPALLAELCGIDVIADFRSRDIAAGGQGAPLVPAFHKALFGKKTPLTLLNLGGIANITVLHPGTPVAGFDTGPANVLLDSWVEHCLRKPYDASGAWAAQGTANTAFLDFLIKSEPWFELPPPKSTGRHVFNLHWLATRLERFAAQAHCSPLADHDIQATLRELTSETVCQAIRRHAPDTREVIVCGGGALNTGLMASLQARLPCPVVSSATKGIDPMAMVALAFAWLAWAYKTGVAAGLPEITGARHPTLLGCCYPAGVGN